MVQTHSFINKIVHFIFNHDFINKIVHITIITSILLTSNLVLKILVDFSIAVSFLWIAVECTTVSSSLRHRRFAVILCKAAR